jgi:transposase-like protein
MKYIRRPNTYPTKEALSKYRCPECKSHSWRYKGRDEDGERRMICECGRTFNKRTSG